MKHTISAFHVGSIICWGLFAWAIAAEIDFLPRFGEAAWWRWQVVLLAGLFFRVTGDRLADFRCRCCGAEQVVVRALLTSSRELLCHRCLHWNPSLRASESSAPLS